MIPGYTITYLIHNNIDKSKWDRCLQQADNGLIYARSFYLDIMAGKWDALVLNDYEAVMPLTWSRKYGFYYLYQPYFVPFLGVFGKKITGINVYDFLVAIPQKFRYWNIDLNEANCLLNNENYLKLKVGNRCNYHLDLVRNYNDIYLDYTKVCRRRIRKFSHHKIQIFKEGEPADVIAFYRRHYEHRYQKIISGVYTNLIDAANISFKDGYAKVYIAKTDEGETIAAYLVLQDNNFVYLLIGGSSDKGRQTGAFYLLTDAIIRDNAGSEKILRFEGSDLPGIATFNAQFGARRINYMHLINNSLPFPLNLLKPR